MDANGRQFPALTFIKLLILLGVPDGIRTRVTAVKGRCPRPLDDGDMSRVVTGAN